MTALAIPIQWTLSNVIFNDGGTATGSFLYDADTNLYSSVAIITTGGSALPGAIYTTGEIDHFGAFGPPDAHQIYLIDGLGQGSLLDQHQITLTYLSGLTNSGGIVDLLQDPLRSFEGLCRDSIICDHPEIRRSVLSGSLVTASAPGPGTYGLLSIGLVGVGAATRRRNRKH